MNAGIFMFGALAALAAGLLLFSYTKAGKKAFHMDLPDDAN
jgi:hypothetical protein